MHLHTTVTDVNENGFSVAAPDIIPLTFAHSQSKLHHTRIIRICSFRLMIHARRMVIQVKSTKIIPQTHSCYFLKAYGSNKTCKSTESFTFIFVFEKACSEESEK